MGADAVIILETGMNHVGYGVMEMWATGVAIKFQSPPVGNDTQAR